MKKNLVYLVWVSILGVTWSTTSFGISIPIGLIADGFCAKNLESETPLAEGQFEITINDENGNSIATFRAFFDEKVAELTHGDMEVVEQYRGQGFGHKLARQVLDKHPNIVRVEAQLLLDNYDAFEKTYLETNRKKQAVMSTPFYKIWSKFGFTSIRITDLDDSEQSIDIVLSKPRATRKKTQP